MLFVNGSQEERITLPLSIPGTNTDKWSNYAAKAGENIAKPPRVWLDLTWTTQAYENTSQGNVSRVIR